MNGVGIGMVAVITAVHLVIILQVRHQVHIVSYEVEIGSAKLLTAELPFATIRIEMAAISLLAFVSREHLSESQCDLLNIQTKS